MTPRYVPLLKGKQGELSALELLAPETWAGMMPLIELVPSAEPDEADVKSISVGISKLALRLGLAASGQRLAFDAADLGQATDLGDGAGALRAACLAAEVAGVQAVPVLRPSDSDLVVSDAALLHEERARGACMRLNGDDVTEDPDDVNDALARMIGQLPMGREDVDLLIDLGAVSADSVRAKALAARLLIRYLDGVDEWRSLTVAAGAFPADLSDFSPWQQGEQPRSDADVWAEVQRRRVPRAPDYGDYAIAHPLLSTGRPFAPAPQLRYTTAGHWLVLKGDRRDERGARQFYDICDAIAASPDFAGAGLGRADARIADPRANGAGPGNATTWRQLGTAHHLDFVVRRLTTLGEP